MIKFTFLLILLFGLAACGGGASGGAPEIILDSAILKLGGIPNGEIVDRVVTVRNGGDAPLAIDTITTSCGCTTATLDPMTLAPGESGTLRVTFDSGAHGPDLRGPLMRQVLIASNDPAMPEAVVQVTADILAPATE